MPAEEVVEIKGSMVKIFEKQDNITSDEQDHQNELENQSNKGCSDKKKMNEDSFNGLGESKSHLDTIRSLKQSHHEQSFCNLNHDNIAPDESYNILGMERVQ